MAFIPVIKMKIDTNKLTYPSMVIPKNLAIRAETRTAKVDTESEILS